MSEQYELWRTSSPGGWVLVCRTKWRLWARFLAWEHTRRGWFQYEIRSPGGP
jgi:hypothetical protein